MRNKIYPKSYDKIIVDVEGKMNVAIKKAMTEMNVKVISFFNNGSDSRFDFPTIFCAFHMDDEIVFEEVIAVGIINDTLSFLTESMIGNKWSEMMNVLESFEGFSFESWETLTVSTYDSLWVSFSDACLISTEALLNVSKVVNYVLEEHLKGKPLYKHTTFSICN